MNKSEFNILVVDDDLVIHEIFKSLVTPPWRLVTTQDYLNLPNDLIFHAAFVDMHLNPKSEEPIGVSVIQTLNHRDSQTEIVAMSGVLDRKTMELCLLSGAQKFLAKPLGLEELQSTLDKILAHWQIRHFDHIHRGRPGVRWVGKSDVSQRILKQVAQLKGEKKSILIEGETGTGKDVLAQIIHNQDTETPFIPVNSSSIPESLFESEMFGHMKGAFTGADSHKMGLAEAAHGGTLFLDEIEAMPLSFQAKLLRFLESGEIRKVGAKDSKKINVRVIAASNRPLTDLIKKGQFREDLYYRLSSQKIALPPLRERPDDVPGLAQYFLESERPRTNKTLDSEALDLLKKYQWPGNVRELKRVIEQLCLISPLPIIRASDVFQLIQSRDNLSSQDASLLSPDSSSGTQRVPFQIELGLETLMNRIEKQVIQAALKESKNDVELAAKFLKISKSNLYKKIKDHQLIETN